MSWLPDLSQGILLCAFCPWVLRVSGPPSFTLLPLGSLFEDAAKAGRTGLHDGLRKVSYYEHVAQVKRGRRSV